MLEFLVPKEFRYYFAQACIRLMSLERDDISKLHYLFLGLDSYNKYLRRNLNLQFNDTKVYSGILGEDSRETIQKIAWSFESDRLETDKWKTLEILCETLESKNNFFVKQKIGQNVKDWATLLVAIIPVVITLLGLFFPEYFSGSGTGE
jgi:S-adenosylmethionine:tRNA-ribosyltransferase-isomerase (queuine synthetase)